VTNVSCRRLFGMCYNHFENDMNRRKETTLRQKEIVHAARKLIVKYGSEHVTIARIAKEVSVSGGAIYRHFKSKRDILSLMIDDIEENLLSDISKNFTGELTSQEILEKVILDHISSIEQRRGVTFQVIAEIVSFGDNKLNMKVYEVTVKYVDKIKDILSEGVKSGIIRPDVDLDAAAKIFFGMTQALVNAWTLSHYSFQLEERYKPLLTVFLKGLAPSDTHKQLQNNSAAPATISQVK
jgi:AcrR family transcriptional regulator